MGCFAVVNLSNGGLRTAIFSSSSRGKLIIQAHKERLSGAADDGGQAYTSARLIARGKQEVEYVRMYQP